MKVLVVGQGGREHAIARALRLSPSVTEVHVLPGNLGFSAEALCHDIKPSDSTAVLALIKKTAIDLVVVGPEVHLAEGLSDELRQQGVLVFGPSQHAAQLESSKIFAKQFMKEAGVPTSDFKVVTSVEETMAAAGSFKAPFVLKADGLAAGKGVFICKTQEELKAHARSLFEEKSLGKAGDKAILEEFQDGWELSFLVLTDGRDYRPMPLSQDHKRLGEGDEGPNTGGMGVVAPLKIDPELEQQIHDEILTGTIRLLKNKGFLYRGVLYVGVIVTADGPKVLEYNVRFGDPEAQVVMPLLNGDWGEVMMAIAKGNLGELKWKPLATACVVLASEGYPENSVKGTVVEGDIQFQSPSSYFLHAGTSRNEQGQWVTNGGRVLNAIGIGSNLKEAIDNAYMQAQKVSWQGVQMRKDIGQKVLDSLK